MVFVDNSCQALLTDQLGNSDTVAGFGKLSSKSFRPKIPQEMKESSYIHKMQKKYQKNEEVSFIHKNA